MDKYQKISVAGLFVINNKVLILKRSSKESFLTGYYELPGGKVEFGETPQNSLEREFFEETNIKISVLNPYRVFSYLSHGGLRHTVEIVYLVKSLDNKIKIKLSNEHDEYQFVSDEELDKFKITNEIKINIREGMKLSKKL